jgi:hypothetical protein
MASIARLAGVEEESCAARLEDVIRLETSTKERSAMTRTLSVLSAVLLAALALLATARPASADLVITEPSLVLAPPAPDLVVSSWNADTFTVTNLPCARSESCFGGPGASSAGPFDVRVVDGYFTFQGLTPYPHWVRHSVTYTVQSLAPGASVPFPFSLRGLCGYVSVTVDPVNAVGERDESNNRWGLALPPALICR